MTEAREPIFNVPVGTRGLLAINLAVFAVLHLLANGAANALVEQWSLVPSRVIQAVEAGGLFRMAVEATTLVTHGFIHESWMHLLVNVGFLLAFGSAAERLLGTRSFLIAYLVSVAAGALAQMFYDWGAPIVMYGASGGVSGCFGLVCRRLLAPGAPPRSRSTGRGLLLFVLAVNGGLALFGGSVGVDGAVIAWAAHLGGFAAGFLMGGLVRTSGSRRHVDAKRG